MLNLRLLHGRLAISASTWTPRVDPRIRRHTGYVNGHPHYESWHGPDPSTAILGHGLLPTTEQRSLTTHDNARLSRLRRRGHVEFDLRGTNLGEFYGIPSPTAGRRSE